MSRFLGVTYMWSLEEQWRKEMRDCRNSIGKYCVNITLQHKEGIYHVRMKQVINGSCNWFRLDSRGKPKPKAPILL